MFHHSFKTKIRRIFDSIVVIIIIGIYIICYLYYLFIYDPTLHDALDLLGEIAVAESPSKAKTAVPLTALTHILTFLVIMSWTYTLKKSYKLIKALDLYPITMIIIFIGKIYLFVSSDVSNPLFSINELIYKDLLSLLIVILILPLYFIFCEKYSINQHIQLIIPTVLLYICAIIDFL